MLTRGRSNRAPGLTWGIRAIGGLLVLCIPPNQQAMADELPVRVPVSQLGYGPISRIEALPDGKHIVSIGRQGAYVWNLSSGEVVRSLRHPTLTAASAVSPDGTRLALAGYEGSVSLWDLGTGTQLRTLAAGSTPALGSMAFSVDGRQLLTGSWGPPATPWNAIATLWDVDTGDVAGRLITDGYSTLHVALSPDGLHALTLPDRSQGPPTFLLWNLETEQPTRAFAIQYRDMVRAVAFSPDGGRFVAVGGGCPELGGCDPVLGVIYLWDVHSGERLRSLTGHGGYVDAAAFSPDGSLLLTAGEDSTVRLWNLTDGTLMRTIVGHRGAIFGACFLGAGDQILTGGEDHSIRRWSIATGEMLQILHGHSGATTACAFSMNGQRVLIGSDDGLMKVWDVHTGRLVQNCDASTHPVGAVAFTADQEHAVTCDRPATVWGPDGNAVTAKVWEVATARASTTLQIRTGPLQWVTLSSDGSRLFVASGEWDAGKETYEPTGRIWEVATGRIISTLEGLSGWVRSASFSTNNFWLMTYSDYRHQLWNAETGIMRNRFDDLYGSFVAVAPDGQSFVNGHEGTGVHIDCASGALLQTYRWTNTLVFSNSVRSVTFAPNGQQVVFGGYEGNAVLFDRATGEVLRAFQGEWYANTIHALAISPDGRWMVTGNTISAALWDITDLTARLRIDASSGTPVWRWDLGMLEEAASIEGPWEARPDAANPYRPPLLDGRQRFYRIRIE